MSERRFRDRVEAGRALGAELRGRVPRNGVIVLGLPRGGVPVAAEVAEALGAPLDAFLVRKLGVPGREELALGAIAAGGVRVVNEDIVRGLDAGEEEIDAVAERELAELERRNDAYRGGAPPPEVAGRAVVLVDDGLATGATMRAAVEALRGLGPERLVVAVPVGSRPACDDLRGSVDDLVCLATPEPFLAVGRWYDDFAATTDADVARLLSRRSSVGA